MATSSSSTGRGSHQNLSQIFLLKLRLKKKTESETNSSDTETSFMGNLQDLQDNHSQLQNGGESTRQNDGCRWRLK